ncbi:MAG: energy transducer TonB [Blastocatellales bacterium]
MKNFFVVLGLIVMVCQAQTILSQSPPNNSSKTTESTPNKSERVESIVTQDKTENSASELVTQGKALYRTARFRQALAKFEAALKQEPDNDEALGMAAETAFRLDSQAAARDYLMRRAELSGQKESVKAYCYHRIAMTYWREGHDLVAKYAEIEDGKVTYNLPDGSRQEAAEDINNGIDYASRTLNLRAGFADAYNIRNLLYAEAALAMTDEEKAKSYRQKALDDLRAALSLAIPADSKAADADFNYPTIRISEVPRTKEEEQQFVDEMMKFIEGGKPIRRVQAVFPSIRSSKVDPSNKGVAADGGAVSLGTGRGALTAAYLPGTVKVEVLVSTEGKVIFTHIVDGRSDLNGAAIVAARSWTFEPAKFEGQPVQLSAVISFDLKPPGRTR